MAFAPSMRAHLARSTPVIIAAALGFLPVATLAGCGGSERDAPAADAAADAPSGRDGSRGEEGGQSNEASPSDAGVCPSDFDAGRAASGPGLVVAMGGASGDSVDCAFCGVVVALISYAGYEFPTLNISSGSMMTCSKPGDALDVFMAGGLVLDATRPGVYQGSPSSFVQSSDCDEITMTYSLPSDAGAVDCGDSGFFDATPSCPAGCYSACQDAGEAGVLCSPCQAGQPPQTTVEYDLRNGCGNGKPGEGSWTVTLTSVTPAEIPPDSGIPSGMQFYVAHGSLSATLLQGASGQSANVTLTF